VRVARIAYLVSRDRPGARSRRDTKCGIRDALLSLLALLAAAAPARAARCDSAASCLAAVEAAQSDVHSLRARFTQTKHLSLLDEPLVSTGRFYFARPDRMRLEIEQPQAAVILINGRDVSIPGLQDSEKQAVAASPMAAMFTELGALFAGSPGALRKHFTVEANAAGEGIELTLTPTERSWQQLYKTIALRFAGEPLAIRSMRLDDTLGDRLEIEMRDVERNPALPDSLFERTPEAR
jgi:outer membrane lipoprotein-sorting protein